MRKSHTKTLPVRYMGTKRELAPIVRAAVDSLEPAGTVADLFAGMGTVSLAMAPDYPVLANDLSAFATLMSESRLLDCKEWSSNEAEVVLREPYLTALGVLERRFGRRLSREGQAAQGGADALLTWMTSGPHAGNSKHYRAMAAAASKDVGPEHYLLVTAYFSGGYFSTRQALELDALRYAIDQVEGDNRQLLAAWLSTASLIINAPGHTAQFLKPNSPEAFARTVRQWRRSAKAMFAMRLPLVSPHSKRKWRIKNKTSSADALTVLQSASMAEVGVVYADPPYTRDHYSRYYHVFESMFLYDYPDSSGSGRCRTDRATSDFSVQTKVERSFRDMLDLIADRRLPLVLSYPEDGLLQRAGVNLDLLLRERFDIRRKIEISHRHSTMGGSSGSQKKEAKERIYVCVSSGA